MAMVPEEQESEFALVGPVRPSSMAMLHDEEPLNTARARVGLMRRNPSRR